MLRLTKDFFLLLANGWCIQLVVRWSDNKLENNTPKKFPLKHWAYSRHSVAYLCQRNTPTHNMDLIIKQFHQAKNTSQLLPPLIQLVEAVKENITTNLNPSSSGGEEVTPPPLIVLLMLVLLLVFHLRWIDSGVISLFFKWQ